MLLGCSCGRVLRHKCLNIEELESQSFRFFLQKNMFLSIINERSIYTRIQTPNNTLIFTQPPNNS